MKKFLLSVFVMSLILSACSSGDEGPDPTGGDSFDRKAMLENLADNIIVPSYQYFSSSMRDLKAATSDFMRLNDESSLNSLRFAWSNAYISWQFVNFYEIGKAEEIAYRSFMNVYPVNVTNIENNISTGSYDLTSVALQDEQGFAALDYLLNGLGETNGDILAFYTDTTNGSKYRDYLTDLVNRMDDLTNQVHTDWTNGYRDTFVENDGSSATSSVDKIVNDFILHFERFLRSGKIGIPAGVFATQTFDDKVEAFYKGDLSRLLFLANLDAMQYFFNGKEFQGLNSGESFRTYLNSLNTIKEGEDLAKIIDNQFDLIRETALKLDESLSNQVKSNNSLMLNTYDELQKNVVYLKVDMLQAFNVTVDFRDTDGD